MKIYVPKQVIAEQELCTHSSHKQLATAPVHGTMTSALWSHGHKCFFWMVTSCDHSAKLLVKRVVTPIRAILKAATGVATLLHS